MGFYPLVLSGVVWVMHIMAKLNWLQTSQRRYLSISSLLNSGTNCTCLVKSNPFSYFNFGADFSLFYFYLFPNFNPAFSIYTCPHESSVFSVDHMFCYNFSICVFLHHLTSKSSLSSTLSDCLFFFLISAILLWREML